MLLGAAVVRCKGRFESGMRCVCVFFLMIRRPPRSTLSSSSAASDVYKRQALNYFILRTHRPILEAFLLGFIIYGVFDATNLALSLIHISEPTRLLSISYAVFCLKKKNNDYIPIYSSILSFTSHVSNHSLTYPYI